MALTPGPQEIEFNDWYDTKFKPAMERGPLDKYVARQAWFAATAPLLARIAALTAQVEQAAQPVGWQKAILRSEEDGMVIIGWDYCTEAEFGHLRIPKRKLYTAPPTAEHAAQPVAERWHVGDSAFESWYDQYLLDAPVHQGAKQKARDAYAAGMGERAAPPKAVPLTDEQAAAMASYFNVPADYVRQVYNQAHGITPATVEKGETS